MYLIKIILWFLLFQLIEIFGAREAPTITLPDQGMIIGVYLKMFRIQRVLGYLGIPYAHPPVSHRRFSPPEVDNLPKWDGVRNASQLPPDCLQLPKKNMKKHDETFMALLTSTRGGGTGNGEDNTRTIDEDCLYLNIYIPDGEFYFYSTKYLYVVFVCKKSFYDFVSKFSQLNLTVNF